MDRVRWTDDVLDERMAAMDGKFDRIFDELHASRGEMRAGFSELRGEMRAGFSELRGEIGGVRDELRGEIGSLGAGLRGEIVTVSDGLRGEVDAVRADLWAFQRQVMWIIGALAIGLLGLLGAFVGAQY